MEQKKNDVKEPEWLDPKNDRQTPYTEEELDLFVDGIIENMQDIEKLNITIQEEGIIETRKRLKEAIRSGPILHQKRKLRHLYR